MIAFAWQVEQALSPSVGLNVLTAHATHAPCESGA